jgi:chaperonin GroES
MLENLRPLRDCILVKLLEDAEKKTAGGIYMPATAKEDRPQVGKVLAVGPGRVTSEGKVVPMEVKQGDHIFFGKFAGTDAGKDLMILREDDVLGVLVKQQ